MMVLYTYSASPKEMMSIQQLFSLLKEPKNIDMPSAKVPDSKPTLVFDVAAEKH